MSHLELVDRVRDDLWIAVKWVLPLVGAGVLAGALVSWLGARVGINDPVVATVARGLAVLMMLVAVSEGVGVEAQAMAAEAWSRLAEVGRGSMP